MSESHIHTAHHGGGEFELLYKRKDQGKGNGSKIPEFIVRIADRSALEQWRKRKK
jgi:hypothetical protein